MCAIRPAETIKNSSTTAFLTGLLLVVFTLVVYWQVLLQQPNHPKAHFYLDNILAEQGNMSEAIVHYKNALSVLGNDEKIQKNLKRAEAALRKVN